MKTKENSTTNSLDFLEIKEILNSLKNDYVNYDGENDTKKLTKLRDYLLFYFLFMSLRRSEIVGLLWGNLDFLKKFIIVKQKGGSYKQIPLCDGILGYLNDYKELKDLYKFESKYIFSTIQNNSHKDLKKPISSQYLYNLVVKMCFKLGINKQITPHSWRKSFVELSLNKGENYNNIMNATGHKTSQMIRYYDNRDKLKNNSINQFIDLF